MERKDNTVVVSAEEIRRCREILFTYACSYITLKKDGNIDKYMTRLSDYLIAIDDYMQRYHLKTTELNEGIITSLLTFFNDRLTDEKLDYVHQRISSNGYVLYPAHNENNKRISFGTICRIPSTTSIVRDGFNKEYIYMTAGSKIDIHTPVDELHILKRLQGNSHVIGLPEKIDRIQNYPALANYGLCSIGYSYGIDRAHELNIFELFRINKGFIDENGSAKIFKNELKKEL